MAGPTVLDLPTVDVVQAGDVFYLLRGIEVDRDRNATIRSLYRSFNVYLEYSDVPQPPSPFDLSMYNFDVTVVYRGIFDYTWNVIGNLPQGTTFEVRTVNAVLTIEGTLEVHLPKGSTFRLRNSGNLWETGGRAYICAGDEAIITSLDPDANDGRPDPRQLSIEHDLRDIHIRNRTDGDFQFYTGDGSYDQVLRARIGDGIEFKEPVDIAGSDGVQGTSILASSRNGATQFNLTQELQDPTLMRMINEIGGMNIEANGELKLRTNITGVGVDPINIGADGVTNINVQRGGGAFIRSAVNTPILQNDLWRFLDPLIPTDGLRVRVWGAFAAPDGGGEFHRLSIPIEILRTQNTFSIYIAFYGQSDAGNIETRVSDQIVINNTGEAIMDDITEAYIYL